MFLCIPFYYRAVVRAAYHNKVGHCVKCVDSMDMADQRCFHAAFVIPDADQAIFVACIYLRHMEKEASHKPPDSLSIELVHSQHSTHALGLQVAPYRIQTFPTVQERLRHRSLYIHATCDFLIFEVPHTDWLISVARYQVLIINAIFGIKRHDGIFVPFQFLLILFVMWFFY